MTTAFSVELGQFHGVEKFPFKLENINERVIGQIVQFGALSWNNNSLKRRLFLI